MRPHDERSRGRSKSRRIRFLARGRQRRCAARNSAIALGASGRGGLCGAATRRTWPDRVRRSSAGGGQIVAQAHCVPAPARVRSCRRIPSRHRGDREPAACLASPIILNASAMAGMQSHAGTHPCAGVRSLPATLDPCYFFLPDAKPGCHPDVFWLGAAAIVLIFSFLGFLTSLFPRCSPLAMPISLFTLSLIAVTECCCAALAPQRSLSVMVPRHLWPDPARPPASEAR